MKTLGNVVPTRYQPNTTQFTQWLSGVKDEIDLCESKHRMFLLAAVDFLEVFVITIHLLTMEIWKCIMDTRTVQKIFTHYA